MSGYTPQEEDFNIRYGGLFDVEIGHRAQKEDYTAQDNDHNVMTVIGNIGESTTSGSISQDSGE